MNPFVCGQLVMDDRGPRAPGARWICAPGMVHGGVCAVGLTFPFL